MGRIWFKASSGKNIYEFSSQPIAGLGAKSLLSQLHWEA
jgi:hypothetical protein